MIFDSPEANQRISDTAAEAPPATFMERFQAADKQGQLRGTVLSPGFAVSEDYDRRIKDIKDAGLGDLTDFNPMWNSKPTQRAPHVYSEGHSIYDMEPAKAVEDPHEAFQKKLEELAQKYPDKAHIIKADKPITGSESYQAAKRAAENAASAYGGPPLTGPIADFAGGMWSMRKDPFQIGTLAVGPMSPVRQGAKAVLTMGLKQAAANAAVEATMQPFVQSWRKSMNDSYGWWDAAEEIGMAGAFGLGADAGVRMLYRGVQARMGRKAILDEQGRVTGYESGAAAADREALNARNLEIQKNLEALPKDTLDKVAQGDEEATLAFAKALKADEDPSVAGAINALRNTDRVTLDGIDDGWRERSLLQQLRSLEDPSEPAPAHFDSAAKAERPRLADDAELPKGTEGNQHYRMLELDNKPVRFEAIDANRITTDPATFQFKGGRDAAGASNALRAVDFNGEYKGKVIVYEREDGSLVVADGHDRVSLANRAPEPQKLDALIFREKDGWTADQVRAEAARKNIQEGTGSLMDVAGAIRRHPEIVDDSMAVSTDFMADARSIARLSDEAFDAVAGGQFNPKHGVLVSDHVPDQARHMEVLRELDRRNPPTEAAARREIGNMLREPANMETLTRVMGIPLAEPHVIEARNDVLAGVADALEGRRQVEQPQFADPETGFSMSAGDVESVVEMARYVQDMRKVPQPKSLYQWIIETGRLKDQSGELTNILGGKNRQLISGKGRNLDDAARSAWEAGYMQGERPTVDEFLQLVDRSVRGEKIGSLHDADMLEEIRVAREMEQELEQYGVKATASPDEIRQHFTRKGGEGAAGYSQAIGRASDPVRLASFARDTEELALARAQGFDTNRTLYHGTGSVIDAFDLAKATDKEGRQRGLGLGKDKIYLTGNQWSAGEWALNAPDRGLGDAPNVIPVYVRGLLLDEKDYHAKFAELSGGRQIFDSTLTMKERDAVIAKTDAWAKSEGYSGIQQVWRDQAGKIMETGQVAMFNPKDIRSPRAAFRGEGPALLASISYEQQAASSVIRRLAEKPGLVSDTLAQAGRAVAEGQPIERAIDATLRRFEDVIGKAGVKGLADQPVRLSPTDERPRFLAALAGSDAAVGRSMRALMEEGQPLFALSDLAQRHSAWLLDDVGPNDPAPRSVLAFHGTNAEAAFDKLALPSSEFGVHFGTTKQSDYVAKKFGNLSPSYDRSRIMPSVLTTRRVLTMDDLVGWFADDIALEIGAAKRYDAEFPGLRNDVKGVTTNEQLRAVFAKHQIDAIRYQNAAEGEGWSYLVWDSAVAKSATSGADIIGKNITPTKIAELAENLRQALDEATTPPPGRLDDPIKDAPLQVERLREDLADDIAVAMGQPSPALLAAIRGYHGSPHDFVPQVELERASPGKLGDMNRVFQDARLPIPDGYKVVRHYPEGRFDLGKIGTGEGAQAFGYGLYIAENETVARQYRNDLSTRNADYTIGGRRINVDNPVELAGKYIADANGNADEAIARIAAAAKSTREGSPVWSIYNDAMKAVRDGTAATVDRSGGHLYEVNIKADPNDFLDWDKPLSQQSEKVRGALDEIITTDPYYTKYGAWNDQTKPVSYYLPAGSGRAVTMSDQLKERGVSGIRYLDQGSRGAGEGSRNYVVFDDNLIEIVAKDGKPVTPEEKKNILADMRRQQSEERSAKQQAEQPQQPAQASPLLDLYQRYVTQGREALDAVMPGTGRMIDEFVQANPEVIARIAEALGAPTGRPQAAQMLEQALPQFTNPRIIDMSKPVLLTPEANARMREIRPAIDETVKMLPPEYRIRVEDSLVFNFGDGDKRLDGLHDGYEKLIYVSMAAGDPVRTSRHEVIHALRQSGLMKDEEFSALYKFADRLGLRKAYEIDTQYKTPYTQAYGNRGADFVEQLLREETVANMFSDYSLNGRRFGDVAGGGMVDRLIDMIVTFMKQVREIMGGYGFRNVYDVFESIESGAMARRGMDQAPEAPRLADMTQDEPPPLARDLADVQQTREGHDVLAACKA